MKGKHHTRQGNYIRIAKRIRKILPGEQKKPTNYKSKNQHTKCLQCSFPNVHLSILAAMAAQTAKTMQENLRNKKNRNSKIICK